VSLTQKRMIIFAAVVALGWGVAALHAFNRPVFNGWGLGFTTTSNTAPKRDLFDELGGNAPILQGNMGEWVKTYPWN